MNKSPTEKLYTECFQRAFEFYNYHLFNDELPNVIITLSKSNSMGYFAANRYRSLSDGTQHCEISLNPEYFSNDRKDQIEILQTLVHECAHLYIFLKEIRENGKASRTTYHTKDWGRKMVSIGLQPVCYDSGMGIEKLSGQKMGDRVIVNGVFDRLTKQLLEEGFKIEYCPSIKYKRVQPLSNFDLSDMKAEDDDVETLIVDGVEMLVPTEAIEEEPQQQQVKPNTRTKYTCDCFTNVWGKDGLRIVCGECGTDFVANRDK